jgi:hypothetical protein
VDELFVFTAMLLGWSLDRKNILGFSETTAHRFTSIVITLAMLKGHPFDRRRFILARCVFETLLSQV